MCRCYTGRRVWNRHLPSPIDIDKFHSCLGSGLFSTRATCPHNCRCFDTRASRMSFVAGRHGVRLRFRQSIRHLAQNKPIPVRYTDQRDMTARISTPRLPIQFRHSHIPFYCIRLGVFFPPVVGTNCAIASNSIHAAACPYSHYRIANHAVPEFESSCPGGICYALGRSRSRLLNSNRSSCNPYPLS